MGASALQAFPTPDNSSVFGVPADMLTLANAIEKQTVMRFTTVAARDAAITVPEEGMVAVLTTDNVTTWYNGVAWRPGPWNAPWGIVAPPVEVATTQSGISTTTVDVTGGSLTFNAVQNRRYEVFAQIPEVTVGVNATVLVMRVADGSNTELFAATRSPVIGVGSTWSHTVFGYFTASVTGSLTVKLRYDCTIAGATASFNTPPNRVRLSVKDVGPNGVPA